MSFRAVTWAFDRVRGLTATEKLVLLALAEFANDEDQTWRGRQAIAERAECSLSAVEKTLRTLKDKGLLSMAHRYAWCDLSTVACQERPAHKHRAGTTYTLHLDVTVTEPRAPRTRSARSAISSPSPADVEIEKSTPVKFTGVGKPAETSGCGHNRKIYGCGECQGSTPVKNEGPHPYPREGIYKIEPPYKPPTKPNHPSEPYDREAQGFGLGGDGVEDLSTQQPTPPVPPPPVADPSLPTDEASVLEAATVVAKCLPANLSALDPAGMIEVAGLLQERLDAGWQPHEINARLQQPLPPTVSRLSSLVAARIRKNIFVGVAPARVAERAAESRLRAQPVVEVQAPVDPRLKEVWSQVERDNPGLRKLEIASKVDEILSREHVGAS